MDAPSPDLSVYGFIDQAAAKAAHAPLGPIRLLPGIAGPKGFGILHVESNQSRVKMIKGLGYKSAIAFISDICKNWQTIRKGEKDSLILVYNKTGYDLRVVIRFDGHSEKRHWYVVTAIPARVSREPLLYTKL